MSVDTVALQEVAEVKLGRQRSPKDHRGRQMRPYVRAANVTWSGWKLDDVKSMNFTDAEMDVYRLQAGDVLLNEASGSATEVGKPARWQGEIDDCAFQNTLIRVRPRKADSKYLLHYFSYCAATGAFARSSRGVGIVHLGRKALAEWLVPLPPIEEQRRIAMVLDAAEDLRTCRTSVLAKLDALVQSRFAAMFADTDGDAVELGDAGEVQGGLQVSAKRSGLPIEVPYLRVANVRRGSLQLDEIKTIHVTDRELDRARLQVGDLLVVEGHGNSDEIGRVAVWDGSIDPCVHQNHLIRVRCDRSILSPRYAEAFLNSHAGRRHLLQAANTTSGLNTISTRDVRAARIDVPDVQMQEEFVAFAEAVDGARITHAANLAKLNELVASLQQRAFRGDL